MGSSGRRAADHVPAEIDILVIGAGFGGLYAHQRFRALGLTVFGLEAADGVGGTWYWNRYPGARCDVESIEYCYSFSPELLRDWEWSERFATQPEILRYIEYVADRFDLRRDIAFSHRVTAASYDAATNRWVVSTDRGAAIRCRFLVTTVGCLSVPKRPDIPGLEDFEGDWVQTGDWPRDRDVVWTDRKVAIIGTGSSGIQSIPVIARDAARLTVFQRTPNYSVPAWNGAIAPSRLAEIRDDYPAYMRSLRQTKGGQRFHLMTGKATFSVNDEERARRFEEAWQDGRWSLQTVFQDITTDPEANRAAAEFVHAKIRAQITDPIIAEKLIPSGFPFGTKRLCLDTDYYATFNRANVDLVDVRAEPIERVTSNGVRAGGRDYPADLIIFAIGFDAVTGPLLSLNITGRNGVTLNDAWADGPASYLGLAVPGFPNLFTVNGPSSPSVLVNMVLTVEHHVDLIAGCIELMERRTLDLVEANPDATAAWAAETATVAEQTLFTQANSWYIGANVPGKPRVFLAYIGGFDRYVARCDQVVAAGYHGFRLARVQQVEDA